MNTALNTKYRYYVVEHASLLEDGDESFSRADFESSKKLTAQEAIDQAEELGDWRCDGGIVDDMGDGFSGIYYVECKNIATGETEDILVPDEQSLAKWRARIAHWNRTTTKPCVLCDTDFTGFGNNPGPLATEGLCCDACNFTAVIPARFAADL